MKDNEHPLGHNAELNQMVHIVTTGLGMVILHRTGDSYEYFVTFPCTVAVISKKIKFPLLILNFRTLVRKHNDIQSLSIA
jgi:hypothetical protein